MNADHWEARKHVAPEYEVIVETIRLHIVQSVYTQ